MTKSVSSVRPPMARGDPDEAFVECERDDTGGSDERTLPCDGGGSK